MWANTEKTRMHEGGSSVYDALWSTSPLQKWLSRHYTSVFRECRSLARFRQNAEIVIMITLRVRPKATESGGRKEISRSSSSEAEAED